MGAGYYHWSLSETQFDGFAQRLKELGLEVVLETRQTTENLIAGAVSELSLSGFLRRNGRKFLFTAIKHLDHQNHKTEAWLCVHNLTQREGKPTWERIVEDISTAFPSRTPPTGRTMTLRAKFKVYAALVMFLGLICAVIYFTVVGWNATFQ